MFRKKPAATPAETAYRKARRGYRRSLNAFVSSLLATVLVVGLVTPMLGFALNGNSQVFTGPTDGRYGSAMLPVMAYGVDLNSQAYRASSKPSYNDAVSTAAKDAGLLQNIVGEKKVASDVTESRTAAAAHVWDIAPSRSKTPGIKAYILPDFIVLDSHGGVFDEGDTPKYVPVDDVLNADPSLSLNDIKSVPSGNLLSENSKPDLPFHMVFSIDRASSLAQVINGTASKSMDSSLTVAGSEYLSPVYTSKEAYVYFSPQSAYEQYMALRAEYASYAADFKNQEARGTASEKLKAKLQSGMYLATMAILESYLNETLPQDASRGWASFNIKAWTGSGTSTTNGTVGKILGDGFSSGSTDITSGGIGSYTRINNTLVAVDYDNGDPLTFDQLRARDTVYHPANTDRGVFTPPYYPIQFHVMNTGEDTYRFQVLQTVSLDELKPGDVSANSGVDAIMKMASILANGPDRALTDFGNNAGTNTDAALIESMLCYTNGLYSKTRAEFYSPLKPDAAGNELYLTRVNVAKTAVLPSLPFLGYKPAGHLMSDTSDPDSPNNPANATGSMYFAWPSFAPSISQHMADDQVYNALNLELYGFYSNEFYAAVGTNAFFGFIPNGNALGDLFKGVVTQFSSTAGRLLDDVFGGNIFAEAISVSAAASGGADQSINKVGLAWSETYQPDDQTLKQATSTVPDGSTATSNTLDAATAGIEGGRSFTGKRAPYVGASTVQRQASMADAGLSPLGSNMAKALESDVVRQMDQQGYRVDLQLAEMGSLVDITNPFAIGQVIATGAQWLLRGGVTIFTFAFGASGSTSGVTDSANPLANWNNPFTLLVSTPGLGPIYSTLQGFALLFVALFTFYLGFSMVLSTGAGGEDTAWPINLGIKASDLKNAIPRVVVAVLMIGVPSAATGGQAVPGLSYWIASFVLMLNDAICRLLSITASTQFMQNLATVSTSAGQSIVSALVFALIAFVMFIAFMAGAIMLLFRTLLLYIFVLVGPMVWAFWVLEKGRGTGDSFNFSSLDGDLPRRWLKGFTQLAFVQLFWVFCFFIIASLFTSPELTANIFGIRTATAASGMATAHAATVVPVLTGLANSVDLIIRAIIILIAFGIMLNFGKAAFRGAAISGIGTAEGAMKALRDRATKPYNDVKAKGKSITDPLSRGDLTSTIAATRRVAGDGYKGARDRMNRVKDEAKRVSGAVKDPTKRGEYVRDKAAAAKERTLKALGGGADEWAKDFGGSPRGSRHVEAAAGSLASRSDEDTVRRALEAGEKQARDSVSQHEWASMTEGERQEAILGKARGILGDRVMDAAAMADAGLQMDGSFSGTEEDLHRVAMTQLLADRASTQEAAEVREMASAAARIAGQLNGQDARLKEEEAARKAADSAGEALAMAQEALAKAQASSAQFFSTGGKEGASLTDETRASLEKAIAKALETQEKAAETHRQAVLSVEMGADPAVLQGQAEAMLGAFRQAIDSGVITRKADLGIRQATVNAMATESIARDMKAAEKHYAAFLKPEEMKAFTAAMLGTAGDPEALRKLAATLATQFASNPRASMELEGAAQAQADKMEAARPALQEAVAGRDLASVADLAEKLIGEGQTAFAQAFSASLAENVQGSRATKRQAAAPRRADALPADVTPELPE